MNDKEKQIDELARICSKICDYCNGKMCEPCEAKIYSQDGKSVFLSKESLGVAIFETLKNKGEIK